MRSKIFTIGLLTLLLTSCGYEPVFEQYQSIPDDSWSKESVVTFDIPITDTVQLYDLYINVRNLNSYPFSNLYLFVNVAAPNGDQLTDTLEYRLADDYGKWIGSKSSRIWDSKLPYRGTVKFAQTGTYSFNIRHGMRNNSLEGISDVGITLENSTTNQ